MNSVPNNASIEEDTKLDKWAWFMAYKATMIYDAEMDIDPDQELYMITWSPDPYEMPNADFETQHKFNINLISDYLQCCACGLFCVEATQMGNPHYHGFYQVNSRMEPERIIMVKVMQKFGIVKITKSVGHYRINSFKQHANCLYYYKKDVFDSMFYLDDNPICKTSRCEIDWNYHYNFFEMKGRTSIKDIQDKITMRDFYRRFYADSINYIMN